MPPVQQREAGPMIAASERGMVDLANRGDNDQARCTRCDWSGVPTYIAGKACTYCPACEENPPALTSSKVARNGPCPCGSGRKAKKCCHG